jgi:hypothetical protein
MIIDSTHALARNHHALPFAEVQPYGAADDLRLELDELAQRSVCEAAAAGHSHSHHVGIIQVLQKRDYLI